jgi:hypothetical protein
MGMIEKDEKANIQTVRMKGLAIKRPKKKISKCCQETVLIFFSFIFLMVWMGEMNRKPRTTTHLSHF